MAKQIQIQIPKPCHEKWNEMTPEQQGKFCGVCSKTVVDFTLMGDGQILETLKKASGTVCGRFSKDQLERPLVKPLQPRWFMHGLWKYVISSFLFFKVANSKAQIQPAITNCSKPAIDKRPKLMGKVALPLSQKITCSGKVFDEFGVPVAGAIVEGMQTGKLTRTNKKGFFIFTTNKKETIRISKLGFEDFSIKAMQNNKFKIVLNRATINIMGMIESGPMDDTVFVPQKIKKDPPIVQPQYNLIIKDSITGEKIPFVTATIVFHYQEKVVNANENGILQFILPNESDFVALSLSAVGYKPFTNLQFKLNKEMEIFLSPVMRNENTPTVKQYTMGIIKPPVIRKQPTMQIEKNCETKDTLHPITISNHNKLQPNLSSLKLFPNPVIAGAIVQVPFEAKIAETILFQASTLEGKIVVMQKEKAQLGTNNFSIKIPDQYAAQILVVKIMNSRGIWIASEQLLVQ